jgi:hypothetical protein
MKTERRCVDCGLRGLEISHMLASLIFSAFYRPILRSILQKVGK